jgi:hypothetical protein
VAFGGGGRVNMKWLHISVFVYFWFKKGFKKEHQQAFLKSL